jgi:hypothetical protein
MPDIQSQQAIHVLTHKYQIGDQDIAVSAPADLDVPRICAFMQFQGEDWFGSSAVVLNEGIAKALVEFYGCRIVDMPRDRPRWPEPGGLDMYWVREDLCGDADEIQNDPSLHRDGLRALLQDHHVE